MTDTNSVFVTWLRAMRAQTGMSQQKVADALKVQGIGLAQTQIAKIERGERPLRLDEAVAIAGVFGTSVDAALGLKPGPDPAAARKSAAHTALLGRIRDVIDVELGGVR